MDYEIDNLVKADQASIDDAVFDLRALAQARKNEADVSLRLKNLQEKFNSRPYIASLIASRKNLKEAVTTLTARIKNHWRATLVATPGADLPAGVKPRKVTTYAYSTDVAIEWCEANLPGALVTSIDEKVLHDHLKSLDKAKRLPDFVLKHEETDITLATDLSAYEE